MGSHMLKLAASELGMSWHKSLPAAGSYTILKGAYHQEIILYLPTGFVNSSGFNVERAVSYFELDKDFSKSLYIAHDEMELKSGKFRLVGGGFSLKGHNGLKSVRSRLGENTFNRIKIGIGRPAEKDGVADWVMGDFEAQELRRI